MKEAQDRKKSFVDKRRRLYSSVATSFTRDKWGLDFGKMRRNSEIKELSW